MTHVLIVDDKEENLLFLQSLLTSSDCTVESAHHGAEALQKARVAPPDLIVSDLLMPVMDGYTLLRHWKADPHLKAIPFIVYTATYVDPEDERLALSLGADDFILKPTEPEPLVARLRDVVASVASGKPRAPQVTADDEGAQLRLYNETLIRKLEEKTLQLEAANRLLQRDVLERESAELAQRRMAERQMAILNALPAHIALVDAHGVIVSVNEAWRRFATANVLQGPEFCVGQDYLAVCEQAVGDCSAEAKLAGAGIRQVLHGETKEFAVEYPCHSPTTQRWFRLMVTPLDEERRIGAVVMHLNITERKQVEEALRTSEKEFRDLAEAMPQIVWVTRPDGWHVHLNQHWMGYTGLTLEESLGHGWTEPVHPDDRLRAAAQWRQATESGEPYEMEYRLRRADGVYHWMLARALPLRDGTGRIAKWFGTCTDIHDLKLAELEISRVNRALKLLSTCNEALIRAEDEHELLDRICRIAVETGGYRTASVGYAQGTEAGGVTSVAHAGAQDGYLSQISVSWNEPNARGEGPVAQVIRTGQPAVYADFTREPSTAPWHALAARHGFRGLVLLPLRDRHRVFGFLGLYSAEVNEPGADEIRLLQELADDLAFGIVHLRARLVQQRLQTAVLKVAAGVSATTGVVFYEQLARNMADAVGAHAGFVAELHANESPSASTLAVVVDGHVLENFDYAIEGTPCEQLATSDTCVIAQHVSSQFPHAERLAALGAEGYVGHRLDGSNGEPLGHLFVVFRAPVEDTAFVTSTMQIFAARAASELERRRTDLRVREQAALIDEARDAIVVRDLDHRIRFWSKGAERIYDWSADEARGNVLPELLAADPATFAEADGTIRTTGGWSGEIRQAARNGMVLTLSSRWTLLRNADGTPRSILSIDTDITEQKNIEAQFLRAQRLESIGILAGGIAHDLNNALSPIMLSLELLSLKFPDADSAELISALESSARHGAGMVRQVLAFARGVEGRRIELQVQHLVEEVEKIANDTFLKHIEVRTTVPHVLWTVIGDPTQIHQVLTNLCVNARDAMPNGGTLFISAENRLVDAQYAAQYPEAKAGPYVLVQVEDTGTGMASAIIEKIFDPFFTTKEVGKGTGLGLSTSLAIVRSHGGFMAVDSEPGKGTVFKVFLPAHTDAAIDMTAQVAAELPRGHGELILFVDDEVAIRAVAKATLEQFGYRTILASDGAEAVTVFAARHAEIAVVITDMTMPTMDGAATIQVLRKINPTVRVIAATGLESHVNTREELHVDHFIAKPYTTELLLKQLHEVLGGT